MAAPRQDPSSPRRDLSAPRRDLSALRRAVGALEPPPGSGRAASFAFGAAELDAWLGGGLARGGLHEVYAGHARHLASSAGFGLGVAMRACAGKPLLWVRQDLGEIEGGQLYGEGLATFGLDPEQLLVVRARDPTGVLRAAAEAVRCAGLGAALVEVQGGPKVLDLTASRRLALSAGSSGVTLVMIRLGAEPAPSAAASRWRVEACASVPLEANAPGRPTFTAALLRHRSGAQPRAWQLEWDRDSASFVPPSLPRRVVPVPARGSPAAEPVAPWRRAG